MQIAYFDCKFEPKYPHPNPLKNVIKTSNHVLRNIYEIVCELDTQCIRIPGYIHSYFHNINIFYWI